MKNPLKIDTIALILSFLYMLYEARVIPVALGSLISIGGIVLVGEYISLKTTKLWISDHIKLSEKKRKPLLAMVIFFGAVLLHFVMP
jgi:hypothetical protein